MSEMSVTITAYTEEDAIRQAMLQFKKVVQIQKVKSGFEPTKCKVVDNKQSGSKKWVTKYYLYTFDSKSLDKAGTEVYINMKLVGQVDTTKSDAVKLAKQLAVQHLKPITIRLVKVIESGSNVISEVIPNDGILGQWKITGVARTSGVVTKKDLQDLGINSVSIVDTEEEPEEPNVEIVEAPKRRRGPELTEEEEPHPGPLINIEQLLTQAEHLHKVITCDLEDNLSDEESYEETEMKDKEDSDPIEEEVS